MFRNWRCPGFYKINTVLSFFGSNRKRLYSHSFSWWIKHRKGLRILLKNGTSVWIENKTFLVSQKKHWWVKYELFSIEQRTSYPSGIKKLWTAHIYHIYMQYKEHKSYFKKHIYHSYLPTYAQNNHKKHSIIKLKSKSDYTKNCKKNTNPLHLCSMQILSQKTGSLSPTPSRKHLYRTSIQYRG